MNSAQGEHSPSSQPAGQPIRRRGLTRSLLADPRFGPLPALLLVMTAVTGVVDAVSILALGRVFVANMTGNVVFAGFAMVGAPGFSLSASLFALAVGLGTAQAQTLLQLLQTLDKLFHVAGGDGGRPIVIKRRVAGLRDPAAFHQQSILD